MTENEISWIAGILEGEGSFGFAGKLSKRRTLRISAGMTDQDIIERLQSICGGTVSVRYFKAFKPLYVWTLSKRLEVVALMERLLPYMGLRRSRKIQELLMWHKDNPPREVGLKHGTTHGYNYYKCRCNACKKAESVYLKRWRSAKVCDACQ